MGDVADAIETAAEHIIATHVHDNRGRDDEHLVPGQGTIDWDAALMTMQKIGYAGTYMMELAEHRRPGGGARRGAARAPAPRARPGGLMIAYIEDIAGHEGQTVTLRGWLHNRRSSGKIHFLTVRDGSGFIQCVMSKAGGRRGRLQAGRSPVAGERGHRRPAPSAPTRGRRAATSST